MIHQLTLHVRIILIHVSDNLSAPKSLVHPNQTNYPQHRMPNKNKQATKSIDKPSKLNYPQIYTNKILVLQSFHDMIPRHPISINVAIAISV